MADLASKIVENAEDLFAQLAFYAEFAPLQDHSDFVGSIYVLRDRGRLTASRLASRAPGAAAEWS